MADFEGPAYIEIEGIPFDTETCSADQTGGFKSVPTANPAGQVRGGVETAEMWQVSCTVVLPKGVWVDFGKLRGATVVMQPVSTGGTSVVFADGNGHDHKYATTQDGHSTHSVIFDCKPPKPLGS